MAILTHEDYQSIRRAIDVTLDDGVTVDKDRILPDAVIKDQLFLGAAESEVVSVYPPALAFDILSDSTKDAVRRATILITASLIVPRIPMIVQEQFGEHRYRRDREDIDDQVARLRSSAYELLTPLMELIEAIPVMTRFRRAPASRGWY